MSVALKCPLLSFFYCFYVSLDKNCPFLGPRVLRIVRYLAVSITHARFRILVQFSLHIYLLKPISASCFSL